ERRAGGRVLDRGRFGRGDGHPPPSLKNVTEPPLPSARGRVAAVAGAAGTGRTAGTVWRTGVNGTCGAGAGRAATITGRDAAARRRGASAARAATSDPALREPDSAAARAGRRR